MLIVIVPKYSVYFLIKKKQKCKNQIHITHLYIVHIFTHIQLFSKFFLNYCNFIWNEINQHLLKYFTNVIITNKIKFELVPTTNLSRYLGYKLISVRIWFYQPRLNHFCFFFLPTLKNYQLTCGFPIILPNYDALEQMFLLHFSPLTAAHSWLVSTVLSAHTNVTREFHKDTYITFYTYNYTSITCILHS